MLEQQVGLAAGVLGVDGGVDRAVGPDHERVPLGVARAVVVRGAIGERDALVRVAKEAIREVELVGERRVVFDAVERDPEDLDALLLKIADSITESASLDCSARGVCLGEPPQQDSASFQVIEGDGVAKVILDRKIRGRITGLEHGRLAEQHRVDSVRKDGGPEDRGCPRFPLSG